MKNSLSNFFNNKKVSIRFRITVVTLLFVMLIMSFTSFVSYMRVSKIIDDNISKTLNLVAENQALKINNTMIRIEDEVDAIASYIYNQVEDPEYLKDSTARAELLSRTENFFVSYIQSYDEIVSNYVYIVPEYLNGDVDGYYYMRTSAGTMEDISITDFFYHDSDNVNSSGWYYVIPEDQQSARWISPYYDPSLDLYVTTYEVPVYIDDVLICMVGINMDFDYLMQSIATISTKGGGSAYLASEDWKVHYHLEEEDHNTYIEAIPNINKPSFDIMLRDSSDQELIRFDQNGVDSVMSFVTLRNGMKLIISEGYKNAYRARTDTLVFVTILSMIIGLGFVSLSIINSQIMSKPIKELTKVAKKIGNGDFDVDIPDSNITEFQILADTLKTSTGQLKRYTKSMENRIYIDELTHVKNKAAYTIAVNDIQHHIDTEPNYCFGVAMFDLNYLKNINDKYGHEAGDIAIKTCSTIICKIYEHSPVFRVGGDEFVVILTGNDYENRDELEEKFFIELKNNQKSSVHFYEAVSIAYGMAVYDKSMDSNYMHVFSRADFEMYKCKNKDHLEVGTAPR